MAKKSFLLLLIIIGALGSSFFLCWQLFFNKVSLVSNSQVLAQSSSDWPQLAYDAQNTGRTTVEVTPNYKLTWGWMDKNHIVRGFVSAPGNSITDGFEPGFKSTVIFAEQMQPIVAEGKVFFGSMNGIIYAVDALTGENRWDYQTGGAILNTAGYNSGVVVVGSMDGKIYGLNSTNGSLKWSHKTGAGINAAPILGNNTVYIGSRDGYFYALDVSNGTLKWRYFTRTPDNPNSSFAGAAIVAPAVLSEDEKTVLFGAENMQFYALNASDGQEKWVKKLIGQSFLYSWPVVKDGKVIVRTMSSLKGAEWLMEDVLDNLPENPSWSEEKSATLNWLQANPHQKTMYVFDINTGQEPYQVAMGRVTGNNYPPHPAVADNKNRVLTYWRTKRASFFSDGPCFGTNHCPDLSAMDMSTGDRIKIFSDQKLGPELDNGFALTVGGDYLYLHQAFRGSHSIRFSDGKLTRLTAPIANWDCANWRSWGAKIVFYGNDGDNCCPRSSCNDPRPEKVYNQSLGFAGMAIAETNGRSLLYINEARAGLIAAIEHE